ncbi:HPr family phosphocarrier protein [Stomatohabitans albus]|uniref:HPr family phosphocarrier protein n=1 Tax=Stomatohabitans albus TaxID=3110766 RepID=UPI00300C92DA
MATVTVKVGSSVGLHARPAAVIADYVARSGHTVKLSTAAKGPIDAKSTMMIITLGAKHGDDVAIECDDKETLMGVAELISNNMEAK